MMICMYWLKDLVVSIGLKKSKSIRHTIKCIFVVKEVAHDDYEELVFRIRGVGIGLKFQFEHMIIFTPIDHPLDYIAFLPSQRSTTLSSCLSSNRAFSIRHQTNFQVSFLLMYK